MATNKPVSGSIRRTVTTLKKVWNMASCTCGADGNNLSKILPNETSNIPRAKAANMNSMTPEQLKSKWIRAVRLALVPLVTPAMMATTQEPMLEPMVRKIPWLMSISPVTTMAKAMEVITEELWMMAVNNVPSNTRSKGLLILARKVLMPSRAAKDSIDPLISSRPTKSNPKPARMPPKVL